MLKTAFSTLACPDWSWRELLDKGRQFGYDGVEVRLLTGETNLLNVPEFRPPNRSRRRRELSDAGFEICGLSSSVRFDDPSAAGREKQVDIGRAYVDMASELDAAFVRVFGDTLPQGADTPTRQTAIGNIADGLECLGQYAQQFDIMILIETHGDYADSNIVQDTLQQVESPHVGVLWDTHHPWRFFKEDVGETFRRIGEWVRHTHWKDSITRSENDPRELDEAARRAAEQASALMSGHQHADYVLFGDGEFPAERCLQLLLEAGYAGWLCLEWEKMWHPELADPETALPPFSEKIRGLVDWQTTGD